MFQLSQFIYLLCICCAPIIADEEEFLTTSQSSTTSTRSTTTPMIYEHRPTYYRRDPNERRDLHMKIIAVVIATVVFSFAFIRLCLVVYRAAKADPDQFTRTTTHRTQSLQGTLSVIDLPDLPPAYGEAVTNIDGEENRLPSYDELKQASVRSTQEDV